MPVAHCDECTNPTVPQTFATEFNGLRPVRFLAPAARRGDIEPFYFRRSRDYQFIVKPNLLLQTRSRDLAVPSQRLSL